MGRHAQLFDFIEIDHFSHRPICFEAIDIQTDFKELFCSAADESRLVVDHLLFLFIPVETRVSHQDVGEKAEIVGRAQLFSCLDHRHLTEPKRSADAWRYGLDDGCLDGVVLGVDGREGWFLIGFFCCNLFFRSGHQGLFGK